MDKPRMVRLQMQKGAPPGGETIGHGGEIYVVSNIDWTVLVPPDVAAFMLEDGRSGARLSRKSKRLRQPFGMPPMRKFSRHPAQAHLSGIFASSSGVFITTSATRVLVMISSFSSACLLCTEVAHVAAFPRRVVSLQRFGFARNVGGDRLHKVLGLNPKRLIRFGLQQLLKCHKARKPQAHRDGLSHDVNLPSALNFVLSPSPNWA